MSGLPECAACGTSRPVEFVTIGVGWMCVRCVADFAFVSTSIPEACRATGLTSAELFELARVVVWA